MFLGSSRLNLWQETALFSNQAAGREQIKIVFMLVPKLTANVNSDALIPVFEEPVEA